MKRFYVVYSTMEDGQRTKLRRSISNPVIGIEFNTREQALDAINRASTSIITQYRIVEILERVPVTHIKQVTTMEWR